MINFFLSCRNELKEADDSFSDKIKMLIVT